MIATRRIFRLLCLPAAMAAFILAAQISGGLVLRTAHPLQMVASSQ